MSSLYSSLLENPGIYLKIVLRWMFGERRQRILFACTQCGFSGGENYHNFTEWMVMITYWHQATTFYRCQWSFRRITLFSLYFARGVVYIIKINTVATTTVAVACATALATVKNILIQWKLLGIFTGKYTGVRLCGGRICSLKKREDLNQKRYNSKVGCKNWISPKFSKLFFFSL